MYIDKRIQTGRQLVGFLNDATCRNNGYCSEVSQNKLNSDIDLPFVSCRCKHAIKQQTSRSLMKETTSRQPNYGEKRGNGITASYDRYVII